jgi:uncharacterized protein YbaP (TraB family)
MLRKLAALALLLIPAVATSDDEPAMIWLAEGTNNRVYFLGSIHLLRAQDHPLPAILETVYDDAEQLVMELDMDDLDPFALIESMVSFGILKDGRTLEDVMGAEMYAEAVTAAGEIDIPIELLEKSEPWLAAMTVQEMVMMRVGFEAQHGIEMYFTSKAANDGKAITGLETAEQQLGFLDGLSTETQNRWLLQSLVEAVRLELVIDEMVQAWRDGDAEFLERELLREMDAYEELHQAILVDRNKRWIAPLVDLLDDEDDYLVIVGAAHLVGDDSVPDLLSREGVRIKQLHESVR